MAELGIEFRCPGSQPLDHTAALALLLLAAKMFCNLVQSKRNMQLLLSNPSTSTQQQLKSNILMQHAGNLRNSLLQDIGEVNS